MDALLGILGSTTLLIDGKPVERWGRTKARAVLAVLATQAGKVVPHETIMRWVWDDDRPQNPTDVMYTNATRIRSALRRLPVPADLQATQGGYRLDIDPAHIDHNRFREAMAKARAHVATDEPEQAITVIEDALKLWRGEPLADVTTAAAESWRANVVQNELLAAHKTLIDQLVALRRYEEAITRLDDLIGTYPEDVALAELRLVSLHRSRQSTNASTYYFNVSRRLTANGDLEGAEHLRGCQNRLIAEQHEPFRPAPVTPPHMLTHEHPCFVGRAEQLARLDALTGVRDGTHRPGVVIVDGIGGVGKTALVLHWAHRRRHVFPGGELFVNMYGYHSGHAKVEPATVVDDFLGELGQPPDRGLSQRARQQLLRSLLSDQKALVILDNVRDTPHVRDLVPLLGNCTVIITSRQLMTSLHRETGAQRITVPVMTAEESTELLSTRLDERGEINEEQRDRLTDLCGGLPMHLSLLAEVLAGKSPDGIAEHAARLDRRALVVGFGDRGDGPTSGAACYDPSYLVLTAAERRLFRLLTLHPGPEFGVAAACACAGRPAEETARGLARLAGAHLLEETAVENRYRFHDLIAEYGAYRRDLDEPAADQDAAARRVLTHYLTSSVNACLAVQRTYNPPDLSEDPLARTLSFADPDPARQWLARERTNLASAVTFAVERECHDDAWQLADAASWYLDRIGCWPDSRVLREAVIDSARLADGPVPEASTRSALGMTLMRLGELPEARRQIETALTLMRHERHRGEASILHNLGRVALNEGNAREALDLFRQGMDIDQAIGNQEGVCWAHCRIGQALRSIDQHEQALVHLNKAAFLAHEIGETSAEPASLTEIGAIHRDLGDLPNASAFCKRALAVAESVPDKATEGAVCMDLCEITRDQNRSLEAVRFGNRAVAVFQDTNDLAQLARALEVLGKAHRQTGDLVDARAVWQQAVDLYTQTGNATAAAVLRSRVEALPPIYQENIPIARSEQVIEPWPAGDEATQPLGWPRR